MKVETGFKQYSFMVKNTLPVFRNVITNFRWLILFCLFGLHPIRAQENEMGVIEHFSVANLPMYDVIDLLSKKSKLNFTYDANDPLMNEVVTFEASDKSPYTILNDLLINTKHSFKQIGNQVVIYKLDLSVSTDDQLNNNYEQHITTERVIPEVEPRLVQLGLIEIDTVFIQDTIFRIDTIRLVDTVYVSKQNSSGGIQSLPVLPADHFQNSTFRKPGWAVGLSVSGLATDFSLVSFQNDWSLNNYGIGANLVRNQKRWAFSFGLQMTQYAQKFNHQYDITTGGYFRQDTLDRYYTVVDVDTSWYYVIDSVWLPLNSQSYNFDRVNRIGYLSLTGEAEYTFFSRPAFSMHGKVGLLMSLVVYRKGLMINEDNYPLGVDFGDLTFSSPVFGMMVGIGTRHRLGEKFDLLIDASYLQYTSGTIPDQTQFSTLTAVGLSVGIRYYF
ncbi:MAG: hypothetical protein Q8O72_13925 [Bacteroidales bacterium]|nr:hypothetical protein [Bacteroidales bacterium]